MKKFFLLIIAAALSFSFLMPRKNSDKDYDVVYPTIILGGGVGAMTSSVYLSRGQILPVVIEGKTPGGVITQSHLVENWPGELGISGPALADKLKKQALANGAVFKSEEVIGVDFSSSPYLITTKDVYDGEIIHEYRAYSVIVAMGTTPNFLGIPGESEYWGKGVSNCATCDGSLYKNKVVAVIGGGDSALVEADYLSNIAREVKIFIRKDHFAATDISLKESVLKKKNVQVFFETNVKEILGNRDGVKAITIQTKKTIEKENVDGVFLAIGSTPNTDLLKGKLALDSKGYITRIEDQKTSKEGVYALGDITDPIYKQAISAAGDGAKAAMQAETYLRKLAAKDSSISYLRPAEEQKSLAPSPPRQIARSSKHEEKKSLAASSKQAVKSPQIREEKKNFSLEEVINIQSEQQFEREINTDVPVLVDFYADWCGPCKRIAPEFSKGAKSLGNKVKFLKVNIDKFNDLFKKYNLRSIPTVIVLSNKIEVNRKIGPGEISTYLNKLKKAQLQNDNIASVLKE